MSIAEPSSNGYTVTFSVTPDAGYYLASTPTVTGSDESSVTVTGNGDGTYTFTTTKFPVTISAPSTAANPIGTWGFQTWMYNNTTYVGDEGIHFLESNTNNVLTGRVDTGTSGSTASGSYYTTALPLNGVFGATNTNLQIRKTSTEANNGLFVGSNKSTTLDIYNLSAGNTLKVSLSIETGKTGTIQFASDDGYVNVKKYGSDDIATTIESGETYVVQGDGVVGIAFEGQGNKYIYSILVSDEVLTAPTITLADDVATITSGESSQSGSTLKTYYKIVHSETAPDTPSDASAAAIAEWTELSTSSVTVDEPGILYAITYNNTKGTKSDVSSARVIYGTHDFRTWAMTNGNLSGTSATDVTWSDGNLTANSKTMNLGGAFTSTSTVQIRNNNSTATSGLVANNGNRDLTIQHLAAGDRIIIDGCEEGSYTSNNTTYTTYLKAKSTNVKLVKSDGTKADVAEGDKISIGSIYEVADGNTMVVTMERATYIYSVKITNSDAMPEPTIGDLDFTTNKVTISAAAQSLGGTETSAIYYGFDANNEPATEYTSEGISITEDCTIYAMAVAGSVKSAIVSKAIETEKVTGLVIGDLSDSKVTITAGTSTASSEVSTYYTLDGSTPSASSTEYTTSIAIDQTRIVKAISISSTGVKSDVVTKKITVNALTPATTWNFVGDNTLNPLTYADETYNGYYINAGGQNKNDGKFKYVTNANIHAKLSWQLEETETANATVGDNGLAISKGGRVFAINDLHVGDKIYITYTNSGTTPLKTSIHSGSGCSISVNGGEMVSSGNTTEIASGDEVEIKNTPEGYEYLVLMPNTGITIQKIEINPVYSDINIDEKISNGTVTADVNSASEGSTVTLTVMPSAGYELSTITVTKASSGTVPVTTVALGSSYTFTMPAEDVTVTATFGAEKTVSETTEWLFNDLTTDLSFNTISPLSDGNSLYVRACSTNLRTFTVTDLGSETTPSYADRTSTSVSISKTLTQVNKAYNDGYVPSTATAKTTIASLVKDENTTYTDVGTGMLAFNNSVEGTVHVIFKSNTAGTFKIYHKDKQSNSTFSWTDGNGTETTTTVLATVATKTTDTTDTSVQSLFANVSAGTVFLGDTQNDCQIYAVKFVPAQDTNVTLTATAGTANRKDFKNLEVSNMTAGMTLYYILPGETVTSTYNYADNDTTAINNVKKNGYLTYWVTDAKGIASKRKTLAVKIAPTLKLKSVATDASTYTLSYTAGNTLHYTLPDGTEQTASGGTTQDVTVTTTGPIKAYQTVDDVTSPTLSTNVYAPTPAIADNGKYDFTTLASLIGKGYTIAMGSYDWGDEVTIGSVKLKKPGPMTSKTLDRFAFTYQNSNTNWRLVSDGRLRLAKRDAVVYIAILDLQAGNFVTVTHNKASSLTYNSNSTATLENVTTLTSGESYQVKSSGHLLLSVPGNTSTEFDITQIEIATAEKVTAPTLEARTESGVVVPNAITLRLGASNFGNTVTAYYTTDGTTPSATNGTAMSASGKVTVDETCTIKAICISTTGVASAVSEYAITLPQADKTGSVVYDFNSVISKNQALTFSADATSSVQVMEKGTSGWEQKGRSDFYPVTDFDSRISVRVGAESVTYDTEAATVKLIRPMAIHNLGVGDEIVIMYSGTGSVINVNSPAGDVFTVADKTVAVGEEISSGAVIKITKTKYANNYIVVGTSGDVFINAIYINSEAPSTVTRPKVALKDVDGDEAIYNITFDAGARLYYWLSTGEETEYRGSDTGSYDLTISKSATLKAWAQYSGLVSDALTTVIYAPTPAPSENGDYDFAESSDGLPADMEVQLDAANSVTVSGKTLYKPTALTEQTFQDKFAFTETNTSGKIKIRTNRQLAFSKGTDMNMALLNMKKGDIIAFDYTGTINFADPTLVKADAVAAARAATRADDDSQMTSGTTYVVQQDCNVLMDLVLTSEAVSIAKMYVAAAPGKSDAAAVDFASAAEDEEELEMGGAASVWCAERTAMVKFKRLANSSDNLPIDSKISSENGYGSNTTNGFSSGNRNIAIHALAKGDTVKVRFSGGDVLFYNHASYGNSISRNGKLLAAGDTIHSGDVLKVEKVDYLNNYFVLRLGSGAAISGIFINKQETEKVLMPTATLNSSNALVITSGKSTLGYDVVTNYTTNGTDPSLLNGTGGPYATFEVQLRKNESKTIKVISISESGAMSRILTLTYDGSVLTSIEDVFADREDELTEEKEAVIYDLQGRRVTTMTPGHIYIVNGKKRFYNKR